MKQKDIDNILKSNKKLDWVKRLYEKDTPSIVLPGQEYPSTHYMESSDNLVYPTIIRNADGKLEYLGNKARDYAIKTNTAIKFDTEEDAAWFGENYKQGTDVLKEFKKGGKITAETIYSVSKQPKVVLTPNDIYAKDGAKVKPGVWNNFEPITYNRANDYPEAERVSLSKIKNPIEGKIYIDDERPFHYKEGRFQEYYSPEEIKQILKFRGEQEANKTSIPSEISNPITNMLYNVDSPYREFIRSQKKGFTYDEYKDGGKIDLSNTTGDRKVFSLDEFKNIVPDYQYQGYLNSGKEGLYKNIDKSKYPVLVDTLPDGSVTYRPYSYESAETSYEDYKKLSQSDQPIKATPIKTFAGGGMMSGMMGGGQGGGNGAGMIMQGVTQAIGGIFSTLDAQKKATEQQGQQNLQNAYQMQQINDLKAMELNQQQQFFPNGGKVEPIYTDNPKDKRLKAYNDSLDLYNNHSFSTKNLKDIRSFTNTDVLVNMSIAGKDFINKNKIKPIKIGTLDDRDKPIYKKPVQPVILKKEVKVPVPKVNYLKNILQTDEEDIKIDFNSNLPIPQAPNEDEQTTKGKPLPDYLIQQVKTPNGMKTYIRKDTNSPWLEQDFEKGGIVQAWIQKFVTGGMPNPYITPFTDFPQNEEFNPYSQYNINSQLSNNAQVANTSVPNVQTNFPQNIGTNYQTSANASQDQINKDNKMADEMMGKTPMDKPKGGGFMSTMQDYGKAVDAIGSTMGDFSNRNGDVRNSAWQTAKKGAAESNPVFGFFHSIDEGLQSVGKLAGGNKGQKGVQFFTDPIGFIMNLGSGIKEREDKKREQQLEYDDRNKMPTIKEPSHYGNYHAKYGSNIKNMEQRVIDDIYSDFDKHFKLK